MTNEAIMDKCKGGFCVPYNSHRCSCRHSTSGFVSPQELWKVSNVEFDEC